MTKFQVAYVPVGVPTFHLESAQKEFEKSMRSVWIMRKNRLESHMFRSSAGH